MKDKTALLWLLAILSVVLISTGALIACGGDDDDDDDTSDDDDDDDDADDDADDDSDDDMDDDVDDDMDDDTGSCETTEAEACDWLVDACDDMNGFGDTAFCESVYEEDCASGDIGDVDGFMGCVCECMQADITCEYQSEAADCEASCFSTYCGNL